MAQEFTIKSETIESKINQLLPSQGGFGAGVDFSASTMVIPIVDLTETAEGSSARQDLQTAFSTSASKTDVENTTTTLVNTTGFYKVSLSVYNNASGNGEVTVDIYDGTTSKPVFFLNTTNNAKFTRNFDTFVVFLRAGDSLRGTTNIATLVLSAITYQIADISGNLTNPIGFI